MGQERLMGPTGYEPLTICKALGAVLQACDEPVSPALQPIAMI